MDLHIHSNISLSGIYSIEEILAKAEKEKVDVLSITDHNSALAHLLLQNIDVSQYYTGSIITGVEIDTVADGITFELLAYNFKVYPVQDWLYKKFSTVDVRQTKLREKLLALAEKKGFKFDKNFAWNAKKEFAHINMFNNLQQYNENKKLYGMEIIDGNDFYRNSTTNKSFPLYLDMSFLWADIKATIDVIHKNGGIVVLAHPFGYRKGMDVDKLLEICKKHKVDGIEVYNPKHTKEQERFLLDYANKNNLLIGGGSDWHSHKGEPIEPFAKLTNLLSKDIIK